MKETLERTGYYVEDNYFRTDLANGEIQLTWTPSGMVFSEIAMLAVEYRVTLWVLSPSVDAKAALIKLGTELSKDYMVTGNRMELSPENGWRLYHLSCTGPPNA